MDSPDPDVLRIVDEVRRACLAHDGQDPLDEAAHLLLKHRGADALDGAWVRDSGFALLHDGALDLAVAPAARRRGVGGALLERAVAGTPGGLTAWSHGDHPAAAALAERTGFERVRELWVMRRSVAVPLPAAEPPAGVTIRSYAGPADDAPLLEVNAAAFAHHPEQGALDEAGLAERMAEPWFDPGGLLLAIDGTGELLGFHWTKRHDDEHGEVYVVGIAPAAQGRGMGRVLTVAGLAHLAAAGVSEVLLYVESDNAAAVRLYSGLGFTHARADTHAQYRRSQLVGLPVQEASDR
ncbi:mycothiol synthase [Nocardioides panacisoli]|uniref:Mycothiol acetyltransferase n=1 Tax=Nocardioides panacisoli TaxID=627624 RepID=A0ABP7IVQ0_9ACTN